MTEITDNDIKDIVGNLDVEDIKPAQEDEINNYDALTSKLSLLASALKISDKVAKKLAEADRVLEIDVPVLLERKSQGKEFVKVFTGFWIEHNNILGQYQGPISFISGFNIENAKAHGIVSTCRNALLELPFGGAAGGISVNKKSLIPKELERLLKNYINNLCRLADLKKDILSNGFGCNERMMSIMYNTYKEISKTKENIKTNFLGKQMQDGGIKARDNAIASGIFCMIDEALKKIEMQEIPGLQKHEDIIKKSPREIKVAIIGFDDIEKELAFMIYNAGYKIIALSDSYGGIASIKGIDPQDAARWQRNHASVAGLPKTIRISNEQMLGIKADVLIISLNVKVDGSNAHKIKSELIFELLPVLTALAATELEKSRMLVPYILASCPASYANYLEFLQNKEERFFDRKEIDKKIEEKSREIFNLVYDASKQYAVSLQDAAYILALQNISKR